MLEAGESHRGTDTLVFVRSRHVHSTTDTMPRPIPYSIPPFIFWRQGGTRVKAAIARCGIVVVKGYVTGEVSTAGCTTHPQRSQLEPQPPGWGLSKVVKPSTRPAQNSRVEVPKRSQTRGTRQAQSPVPKNR